MTMTHWRRAARTLIFGLFGFIAVSAYAPRAEAHAKLISSVPAAETTVSSPQEIVLTLSQTVQPLQAKLTEVQTKSVIDLAAPKVNGAVLHYTLGRPLAPGKYEMFYRLATPDTHVVSGTIMFTVAAPAK
jgi:methionine-rich copper-binding protein CopC